MAMFRQMFCIALKLAAGRLVGLSLQLLSTREPPVQTTPAAWPLPDSNPSNAHTSRFLFVPQLKLAWVKFLRSSR